jgi:hypothetical protein
MESLDTSSLSIRADMMSPSVTSLGSALTTCVVLVRGVTGERSD